MRHISSAKFLAAMLTTGLLLQGCATIIHEKKQNVTINTVPAGANLNIDGRNFITPATVPLSGKSEYYFTVAKPGYKSTSGKVDSHFRVWSSVVGNIFNLSGLIGFAVDTWGTGNAFELEKDNTVTLQPETGYSAYPADSTYNYSSGTYEQAPAAVQPPAAATTTPATATPTTGGATPYQYYPPAQYPAQ